MKQYLFCKILYSNILHQENDDGEDNVENKSLNSCYFVSKLRRKAQTSTKRGQQFSSFQTGKNVHYLNKNKMSWQFQVHLK